MHKRMSTLNITNIGCVCYILMHFSQDTANQISAGSIRILLQKYK